MAADWRTLVKDAAAAKAGETRTRNRGASDTANISRVGMGTQAHVFLVQAAKARGISISGYIRRATLAHVAMDLGMEATDLFALDLAITPIGRRGSLPDRDLDGEMYGRWEVEPRDDPAA